MYTNILLMIPNHKFLIFILSLITRKIKIIQQWTNLFKLMDIYMYDVSYIKVLIQTKCIGRIIIYFAYTRE